LRPPLVFKELGRIPYRECLEIQREAQRELIAGSGSEQIIICEHSPTITQGRSTKDASGGRAGNILLSREELATRGIELFEDVERGGDTTYHGPGQLVVYPILNLNHWKRDVHLYMRTLEEVIIQGLQSVGVKAGLYPGRTGVWTETADNAKNPARKIASIGVRISRWCTLHGFAINLLRSGWIYPAEAAESDDTPLPLAAGFAAIRPCGFSDVVSVSAEEELSRSLSLAEITKFIDALKLSLEQRFFKG
jgi:lipoate-protein ligase B